MSGVAGPGPDAACCVCDGRAWRPHSRKRGYRLFSCDACGHVQVWPLPTAGELVELYQPARDYYTASETVLSKTSPDEAEEIVERCAAVIAVPGSVLDVGSNNGALLYHLRERGWTVAGVEVNPHGVAIARAHGLQVFQGTLADAALPPGTFDLVTLNEVIEHVADPGALLAEAVRVLRPGGCVRITTPNADSGFPVLSLAVARLTRDLVPWYQSEPPYHLHCFGTKTITALLARQGLTPVSTEYTRSRLLRQIGNAGYFDDLKQAYLRRKNLGTGAGFWGKLFRATPGLAAIGAVYGLCKLAGELSDLVRGGRGDHLVVYAVGGGRTVGS